MRVPSASGLPSPPGEAGETSMQGGVCASVPSTQAGMLQGSSKGGLWEEGMQDRGACSRPHLRKPGPGD